MTTLFQVNTHNGLSGRKNKSVGLRVECESIEDAKRAGIALALDTFDIFGRKGPIVSHVGAFIDGQWKKVY